MKFLLFRVLYYFIHKELYTIYVSNNIKSTYIYIVYVDRV